MNSELEATVDAFRKRMIDNLWHIHGQALQSASTHDAYMTLCYTVRDHLIQRWRKTVDSQISANPKCVYYLSAEYLLGKQLSQNMLYSDTRELAEQALAEYGIDIAEMLQLDVEPGLGNGGLGRLAACFLDSLATLDIPAVGYGIRYEFGIFQQDFRDGWQVEKPDEWLLHGNPWEFPQADDMVEVGFWGHTEQIVDEDGTPRVRWVPKHSVLGEPCTTLVPGFGTETVNILRLWRARATEEFDFQLFDVGDYTRRGRAEGLLGEHQQSPLSERRDLGRKSSFDCSNNTFSWHARSTTSSGVFYCSTMIGTTSRTKSPFN